MDVSYRTTLELDKIIARAVQLCTCAETKEMMRAIEPFATTEEERYALAQTNAINALLLKNGSPRFGAVHEVRRVVAHAAKGGILSMGELLEIAAALRNFSGLAQWYGLTDHDMLPTDDLFFALAPQPVLEKQIGECIISPEEMADTASVTLRDLRRKIRATEDSIRTKLDAIIKNSTTNKFLQDAVVSIRNGRYVVPVRAEYRGSCPCPPLHPALGRDNSRLSRRSRRRHPRCFLHWLHRVCGAHRCGGSQRPHYAAARPRAGGNHPHSDGVLRPGGIAGAAVQLQL